MADSIFTQIGSVVSTAIDNKVISTTVTEHIMTDGQTEITVSYNPNGLQVLSEGLVLPTTEYTATNGTSITLGYGADAGEKITVTSQVV